MANATGIGIDLVDVLNVAKKADDYLGSMVDKSEIFAKNMRSAISEGGTEAFIGNLKNLYDLIDDIQPDKFKSLIDVNILNKASDALSDIAIIADRLSTKYENIQLVDNRGLKTASDNIFLLEAQMKSLVEKESKLRKEIKETVDDTFEFSITNPKTGKPFSEKSKTYKKMREQRRNELLQESDLELRHLNEQKKLISEKLAYANKSEAEKAEVVQKYVDKQISGEKRAVNQIRNEYNSLWKELKIFYTNRAALEKESVGKKLTDEQKSQYDSLIQLERDTEAKIRDMYSQHQDILTDITIRETANRSKIIAKEIKDTPFTNKEARSLAKKAKTGTQMEVALKAVENALMNTPKTRVKTIKKLQEEYLRLRAEIENLTKAQKSENTLQPSIRNEYSRLLKSLEDITIAKQKLASTSAYSKGGDTEALASMTALEQREADILARKKQLEEKTGSLLDEVIRENAARQAKIRTEEFIKEEEKLAEARKKYAAISGAEAQDAISDNANADNVRKAEKAIQELIVTKEKLNFTDDDYADTVKALDEEIKKHRENIRKTMDAEKYAQEQKEKYYKTKDGALEYAKKEAKSLNQIQKAIKYLDEARKNEDITTTKGKKNYRELTETLEKLKKKYAEVTGESQKTKEKMSGIKNSADAVKKVLVGLFAIDKLKGYMNKLLEVRGEFELQQKALRAIIQDADEADKIFNKTVALAITSPFRIKDLVTYTKQLAAYRIETDKLYDTTKMLADVSSGLGVDMGRLILAFGQVRAASYLRATEVRQFTEAGVPLLEELAKQFSVVEGRVVGVGEVMERVTKRMVSFENVNKVFKRMTSEGGVFFQMQEIQADTLRGKITNLKDSVDVMLNEMGKAEDTNLKSIIGGLTELTARWEDLLDLFKTKTSWILGGVSALTLLGSSKFALSIINVKKVTKGVHLLARAINVLKYAVNGLVTLGVGGLIVGAIAGLSALYLSLTKTRREQERFNKSVEALIAEGNVGVERQAGQYKELVKQISETIEGSAERASLIEKINANYGQYLDFLVTEKTTVEELSNAYETLVERMRNKAAQNTLEKGFQEIDEDYTKKLTKRREKIAKKMSEIGFFDIVTEGEAEATKKAAEEAQTAADKIKEDTTATKEQIIEAQVAAEEAVKNIVEAGEIRSILPTEGEIKDIFNAILSYLNDMPDSLLQEYVGREEDLLRDAASTYYEKGIDISLDYRKQLNKLLDEYLDKRRKEGVLSESVNRSFNKTLKGRLAQLALIKEETEYEKKKSDIYKNRTFEFAYDREEELERIRREFEKKKIELKVKFGLISEEGEGGAKQLISQIENWEIPVVKTFNDAIKREFENSLEYNRDEWTKVLVRESQQTGGFSPIIKNLSVERERLISILKEEISLKDAGLKYDQNAINHSRKMIKLYETAAKIAGVELDVVERIDEETVSAVNQTAKMLGVSEKYLIGIEEAEGSLEQIYSDIEKKKTNAIKQEQLLATQIRLGVSDENEKLNVLREQIRAYEIILNLLGGQNEKAIDPKVWEQVWSGIPTEYSDKFLEHYKNKSQTELKNLFDGLRKEAQQSLDDIDAAFKGKNIITPPEVKKKWEQDLLWYTEIWQRLGGVEEEKDNNETERRNSLYDERIKVIDDMHKKFEELNKTMGKGESIQKAFESYIDAFATAYSDVSWIPKNTREMSVEEFVEKVLNFPDENDIVRFFDRLSKEPMRAFEKIKVEIAKGDYVWDMAVNVKKDADKELIKQVEEMFDKLELSKQLDELGFSPSIAEDLFDIDYRDIISLKNALREIADKFIGTDMQEEYESFVNRINDMERDAAEERMKTYVKYLTAGMNERVKMKVEEAKKLQEIDALEADEEVKNRMRKGVQKETNDALQKLDWQEFKDSEIYSLMFEDIEYVGTKALTVLKQRLEDVKGALTELEPTELKEVMTQMNKIDDITIERNPFSSLIKSIRELRDLSKEEDYQIALMSADTEKKEAQSLLDTYDELLAKKEKGNEFSNEDYLNEMELVILAQQLGVEYEELRDKLAERVALAEKEGSEAEENIGKYVKLRKAIEASASKMKDINDLSQSIFDSVAGVLESFGVDVENTGISSFIDMMGGFTDGMGEITDGIKKLDPIKIISGSVKAIASLVKGMNEMHDAKYAREIERETEAVERLSKQYEQLEDILDRLTNIEGFKRAFEDVNNNLERQIGSYNKMISAEKMKKNPSQEDIDGWTDAIEDARKQILENSGKFYEELGGIDPDQFASVAQSFIDSWLDAFKETGDGLTALEDSWEEYFDKIVSKQLMLRVTDQFLANNMAEINKLLETTSVDPDEFRAKVAELKSKMPQLNDILETLAQSFGYTSGMNGGQLSNLQRGIQGVTEQTAQVIEALLNSMRFFVASSNEELKQQTKYMRSIYNLLDNMKGTHPSGGVGIKAIL